MLEVALDESLLSSRELCLCSLVLSIRHLDHPALGGSFLFPAYKNFARAATAAVNTTHAARSIIMPFPVCAASV